MCFRRRVLRARALKSCSVRVFVAVAAVLLLGGMCTASYLFLRPRAGEAAVWRLLFDTSTVSILLWMLVELSGMAGLLYILALVAVLAYYSLQMTSMIQGFSGAYLDQRTDYT